MHMAYVAYAVCMSTALKTVYLIIWW